MTVPVASTDLTWLLMDRPNNLMYVNGVLRLEQAPDWEAVEALLHERILSRFPVFRRRAEEVDGTWVWADDEDFSLANHVRRVTLPAPGSLAQAEAFISARFSEAFDSARPLWQVFLIDGLDDGQALLYARFHHGIADGVRLVQVLLSLLDPLGDGAAPGAVGRPRSRRPSPAAAVAGVAKGLAGNAADLAAGGMAAVGKLPQALTQGWIALRSPVTVTDAISGVASEDNMLVNSWRSVSRLTLSGRAIDTVWSGTPGVEKKVAWVWGLPLERIRDIGKVHTVTINDVMLSAVALGVTEYLTEKGEDKVDQVSWMVPVSLKPIDTDIPEELGNHFAVVLLPMPLGITEPHALLRETHRRMNRIKNSAEPMIIYGIQRVIAETPAAVSVRLTNFVANKTVGVITNVPGPRVPMALAGTTVKGILGWVPTSGDQPLGVCIFSYNGEVNIGIASDAGLVPDPDRLAELIEHAVDELAAGVEASPV